MSLPTKSELGQYRNKTSITIENNKNHIKTKENSDISSNSNNKSDYIVLNIYNNIKQNNSESNTNITITDNTNENETVSNIIINNNNNIYYNNKDNYKSLNPKQQNIIYYDNERNNPNQYPYTDNSRNQNNLNKMDNNIIINKNILPIEIENNSAAPITPGMPPISKTEKEYIPKRKTKIFKNKFLKEEEKKRNCKKICLTIIFIILFFPIVLLCVALGGLHSTECCITCDDLSDVCKTLCCCCCKNNKKKRKI